MENNPLEALNLFEIMRSECRFVHGVKKSRIPNRIMMKFRILGLTSVLLVLISFVTFAQEHPKDPAAITAGKALFDGNCKACHRVKQKLVGPALAGFESRVPTISWVMGWVRNSSKVIASGDEYAVKIYNEYNKSQMLSFNYTDAQILNILAYVKSEAEKPDVAPQAAAGTGPATAAPS